MFDNNLRFAWLVVPGFRLSFFVNRSTELPAQGPR